MSSRLRQSGVSTQATPRRPPATLELPPYEPPAFPLNDTAQRALQQLLSTHSLAGYKQTLTDATVFLTDSAGEINDALSQKELATRKAKTRRQNQDTEDDEADARIAMMETELEDMREKVQKMTQRMDESVRKMIDTHHAVDHIKDSLSTLAASTTTASLTSQPSQRRSQRRRRRDPALSDDEASSADDEYADIQPTLSTQAGTQTQQPLSTSFRTLLQQSRDRYQSRPLRDRYAKDNDYRSFKRLVHDAQYPDGDAPPLPHEDAWFPASGAPAPGVTTSNAAAAEDGGEDSDDDLAIARETVSTKCPLTLREFATPLTSRKCPHSFEAEAILGMIEDPGNMMRVGGDGRRGNGEKAVQCPVPGCQSILTRRELWSDPVLKRRIARVQRANALAEEEDEEEVGEEGGRRRAQTVASSDDGMMVEELERGSVRPKDEALSGRVRGTPLS